MNGKLTVNHGKAVLFEPWLQTHRQLVEEELEDIRAYIRLVEDALENKKQVFASEVKKQIAQMPVEQDPEIFVGWIAEGAYQVGKTFPRVLRYSLFVSVYSLLEHTLLRIADHLHDSQKLDLSPKELGDKGITRAQTYLKKVARMPFPDDGQDWVDIAALGEIRNIIVHGTGYLPDDHPKKKKIDALIGRWATDISLDNNQFAFSSSFIERVIETYKRFLVEVFDKIKDTSP